MASDRMHPGQLTVKYISGSKYTAYLSYHAFCVKYHRRKTNTKAKDYAKCWLSQGLKLVGLTICQRQRQRAEKCV